MAEAGRVLRERVVVDNPLRETKTILQTLEGGQFRIVHRQRVAGMIEAARELAKVPQPDLRGGTQRHRQRIASIPASIYNLWADVLGHPCEENQKEWFKRLNDPNNAYMRTGGGHL